MKYFGIVYILIIAIGCKSRPDNKANNMIEGDKDKLFYKELAEFTIQCIPDSSSLWDSATLIIKIQPGVVGLNGHFFEKGIKKWLEPDSTREITKRIFEFHERMTRDGTSKWNKMEFELTNDMKFENKFIWDSVYQAEVDKYNKEAEDENPNYKRPLWPWEKLE